jgi:hypothetical protein
MAQAFTFRAFGAEARRFTLATTSEFCDERFFTKNGLTSGLVGNFINTSGKLWSLYVDGDNNNCGLDYQRPRKAYSIHIEACGNHLHDERADQRAHYRCPPAG